MALVGQSSFDDKEVSLIYIAANATDAEKVETVLTENEIDYTLMEIRFDSFFSLSERPGIGFYAISGQADYSRNTLRAHGIKSGIWPEDIDPPV